MYTTFVLSSSGLVVWASHSFRLCTMIVSHYDSNRHCPVTCYMSLFGARVYNTEWNPLTKYKRATSSRLPLVPQYITHSAYRRFWSIMDLYRPPFPAFSPADPFSAHQPIFCIWRTYNFQHGSRDDRRKARRLLEGNAPQRPVTEWDESVLLSVRQSGLVEAHRVEDAGIASPDCRVLM